MGKVTLKSITTKIGSGATPTGGQKSYQNEGVALIRSQNVLDFRFSRDGLAFINEQQANQLDNVTVEENDVLLNITGDSIARVCLVAKEILPARVNQHVSIIRTKKDIDSRYILYYLQYLKPYLLKICKVGGTRNALTKEAIEKLEVEIRDHHKKIAAVLSALDAKIELNQRINAELEQVAKTLYDYWFVQFDFPNEKGEPYKSSGGKMVWNSKLGKKIPGGWKVETLGKMLKTALGGTPSTKNPEYWEDATIPWLNSGDLSEFPIIHSSAFVTQKGVENSATTILPRGSVVISLVRYIRPSIIALAACANQSVVGIRETEELKNTYIYPYLVNEVPRLMTLRTGAQQPHINKEVIDETPLYIPSTKVLEDYYKISEPIFKMIINLAFESQSLIELRDWLLPLLMNGQITIC